MEQSTSWEACEEIPRLLQKSKVHNGAHNSLLPVRIISQINPVHTLQQYNINFNLFSHLRLCLQAICLL